MEIMPSVAIAVIQLQRLLKVFIGERTGPYIVVIQASPNGQAMVLILQQLIPEINIEGIV